MFLVLRFCKLLAVLMLTSGTVGAFVSRDLTDRRRFAHWLAGPGFGLTWILGFVLASVEGVSFGEPWISGSLLLSLVSQHAVLYSVGKEGRRTRTAVALALMPLLATLALMSWKPSW